ncbi:MAG: hypothetical protein K2R93_02795 [Gemmatimonadaceae bacterium]|nr:hypothetical protein [Gemmatimonadaceae bacterium]
MFRSIRRITSIASVAAVATLAACADSSPTGLTNDAAFASGSGTTSSSTATKIEIALTRPADGVYRNAKGKAKYATSANERELQIEVENVPAGTMLTFTVGGSAAGTATADAFGKARLNLNTKLGQTVPMVSTGTTVRVSSPAGVVVTGSF